MILTILMSMMNGAPGDDDAAEGAGRAAKSRRTRELIIVALASLVLTAGIGFAALMFFGSPKMKIGVSDSSGPGSGGGSAGTEPVDSISAIDLEVGVIDGANDLELTEKDYDCDSCQIHSGKLEISENGTHTRLLHNTYDDGLHCSFDETYYFSLSGELIHAITIESCWETGKGEGRAPPPVNEDGESPPPKAAERWDETRTYFQDGRAIKSQRRGGAAPEELDGMQWEDDVAPVGDSLTKRAQALLEFARSDEDDYESFFDDHERP